MSARALAAALVALLLALLAPAAAGAAAPHHGAHHPEAAAAPTGTADCAVTHCLGHKPCCGLSAHCLAGLILPATWTLLVPKKALPVPRAEAINAQTNPEVLLRPPA